MQLWTLQLQHSSAHCLELQAQLEDEEEEADELRDTDQDDDRLLQHGTASKTVLRAQCVGEFV